MAKLRILLVDDEPLARDRLRAFLRGESEVEIVGECGSGPEAIAAIERDRPDIVFLDMQMPGCDGLQVAAGLPPAERPAIVFVTAHDQFAIEAFGVQAVDYLLKPFDQERFRAALSRATEHVRVRRASDLGTRLEHLLADAPAASRRLDGLAVKTDGRMMFLKPADISWVEASDNYVVLHLADATRVTTRETLSALEERLGRSDFTRINRSALVNLDQVKELQPTFHGDYVVVLRDGTRLPLSRSLRGKLENRFSRGA